MLHYPFRQSRLKNHTPSARQSNDINPESNDRFGFNPNRPFERAVLHLMPFMTLSVRCHSLADTLPLFLFCRSPLRLQQKERQTARQSNDINPESNDRFGLTFRKTKLPACRRVEPCGGNGGVALPRYIRPIDRKAGSGRHPWQAGASETKIIPNRSSVRLVGHDVRFMMLSDRHCKTDWG